MGLFGKKPDCPICGSPTPRLLPTKIEGQPICKDCDKKISMDMDMKVNLTLDQLRDHLAFREENAELHKAFKITRNEAFVHDNHKLFIDDEKQLFYIDSGEENPTIFKFSELTAFRYVEVLNVRGGILDGLKRYQKAVIDFTREHKIKDESYTLLLEEKMRHYVNLDHWEEYFRGIDDQMMELQKPIKHFKLEFDFDHPYWKTMEFKYVEPAMFKKEDAPSNSEIRAYLNYCEPILKEASHIGDVMLKILDAK
ncbi:MAG: DUF4428 domain-containing protein [Firmicutes bacterium]|nr:DUF4428 domain-containing protein [Bacillota bacterium]